MSGLPAQLLSLLTPAAYPHPVGVVRLIETHISWVLLTGEFAYKLKRPVQYPFADLRSAERRAFFCAEEIRLNRRFAPELYLDVCTINAQDGGVRVAGDGPVVEHAVRMRQFECEDGLDRLLATGRVGPHELERFGRDLAAIHDGLPVAQDPQDWGRSAVVCGQILENIAQCLQLSEPLGTQAELRRLCEPFVAGLRVLGPWMDARRRAGHVRECHGDLHSRNVVRYAGRLVGFDCIDFEPAFRWIDVAEEIAFLLMDLDARRCPLHAQAFLGGYLSQSGDYQACRLLRTYGIHRALVRTKVTALEGSSASQPYVRTLNIESHKAYVECIHRLLEPGRPMLILMHGLSGSGKTWLASRIAPLLGAVHVRSDVERKRLAGLGQSESSHSAMEEGLYSPFSNQRVYEHLRRCADDVLAGGYTVIVDATFGRRDDRERFRSLAAARAAELCVVDCHAPQQRLESRLVERQREHSDASEADLAVLAWQQSHLEPIAAAEQLAVIDADTTREAIVSEVYDSLREQARDGAKR